MQAQFRPPSPPCPAWRRAAATLLAGLAVTPLAAAPAMAHIKWFEPYDVSQAPMPIAELMSQRYLLVMAGFALLVAGGFLLDRLVAPARWVTTALARHDSVEALLRAALGAFFVALFTMGGIILTPELRTGADWPAWLQLGIAASLFSARSCFLGGIGILLLYGYGIALYGAFHLADYPIFLGLAAYLILTSCRSARLRELRMPILYVTFCVSMMWGALEKWAYPQWTYPLLAERPYLAFGFQAEEIMVLAGFVEFALAFYILTGLGLLRLGIGALCLIFVAAVVDFGKMDAIGHLPLIAAMMAMFLHGPTRLHHALHDAGRGMLAEARRSGALFLGAVGVFFFAYYGLQHTELRSEPTGHRVAALAAPDKIR
ncbi:hypothetical protein ACFQS7_05940 [Dankookia sp. GCM10030260]|uniref:hypothetical protein n=1 Tax=Dankookia sp. GCM10030260 TaxID=3273390 RepID=UPI00362149F7